MNELININDNYNMNIKNIRKLGITTINDIFVINSSSKKYIVKIYNVDEENKSNLHYAPKRKYMSH